MSVSTPALNSSSTPAAASLEGVYEQLNISPATEMDIAAESVQTQEGCNDDNIKITTESQLMSVVASASHGVTEGTYNSYMQLWKKFLKWVGDNGWGDLVTPLSSSQPPLITPFLIIGWIMDSCDDKDHKGKVKPQQQTRSVYSHAQKMRAAMTFHFSKIPTIGLTGWHLTLDQQRGLGNPSVSHAVSSYMVSLRRRKAADGEAATSAKAITPQVMRELFEFNHRAENWDLTSPTSKDTPSPGMRRLLQAVYTVSFLCMLRSDEALNLQMKHLQLFADRVDISLNTRKTHQHGGIKPFPLSELHETEDYLCFVRALAEWLDYAKLKASTPEAYLFPKLSASGAIERDEKGRTTRMTSERFLAGFRSNLKEVGIDGAPYGTHSFRRGGCQWLACDKRWPLRDICDWGGWSTEFSSMTIVKYLISWSDDPRVKREDYFNPNRPPFVVCPMCGRSCHCS